MPKALGRYLLEYHSLYKTTLFADNLQYYHELSARLKELDTWIKSSKAHSFKLQHLIELFNNPSKPPEQCRLNRLLSRKVLVRLARRKIIPNNQVKDKKEYLIGSKVFALRCANSKLATRMQMR